jgi:putative thioredoxin
MTNIPEAKMGTKIETIVNITLENAKQYLIDESFIRPVVIDFWADWCAPCKVLLPILEKIAKEYAGAFLLAKVNADELNMLASQFGVRSLPTIMIMKDGQPIDGFASALPEVQVREVLEKYLPKVWDKLLAEAKACVDNSDHAGALPLLRRAYEESKHLSAVAYLLAESNIALSRFDTAETILSMIKMVNRDENYARLIAEIELKKQAAKTPELVALEAAHLADPTNLHISFDLAVQYHHEKSYRPSLELLIDILRKDRNFADGKVRKALTDSLVFLGKGDPLAIEFQRKLFTLLY